MQTKVLKSARYKSSTKLSAALIWSRDGRTQLGPLRRRKHQLTRRRRRLKRRSKNTLFYLFFNKQRPTTQAYNQLLI